MGHQRSALLIVGLLGASLAACTSATHTSGTSSSGAESDAGPADGGNIDASPPEGCHIDIDRCSAPPLAVAPTVSTVAELVAAVNNGAAGALVVVAPGTYELDAPLRPKSGMTIRGAGAGKTILRNAPSWAPGTAGLDKDEGAQQSGIDCDAYLFSLPTDTKSLAVTDMTLTGPKMHGGVCGAQLDGLELARLEFKSFLWSGVRTFIMTNAHFHHNVFIDAGGKSSITSGSSGGGLFLTYTSASEIDDNRFSITAAHQGDYYGVKGREARNVRIHHNTIDVFFSIELPFESDWSVEIDHNRLGGAVSIPKYAGGTFPEGGYTFHVHHNVFTTTYAFEFQRNAIEIDHNLFDFSTTDDGGNLISGFDAVPAPGGARIHDNRIRNPGRGLYWNTGVYNDFAFTNNHVIATTTVTPRTEGLFDFRPDGEGGTTSWSTIQIKDNIFELEGTARPLMRNAESHAAVVENNKFVNVSDAAEYANPDTGAPRGPRDPLQFRLGASDELTLDEWKVTPTACSCPSP